MSAAHHASFALGIVVAAIAFAPSARADATHDCVEAANDGQGLRDAGKWSAARAAFVRCSADVCPGVVKDSCRKWDAELEPRVPTVTFAATSDAGEDLATAVVTVDGVSIPSGTDGRAVPLDPGPHEIVFRADGFAPARQTVVVREGEKSRSIVARLARPTSSTEATPNGVVTPRSSIVPLVVSGAVAALGTATFAVFGLWGRSERDHLDDTCASAQTCSSSDVSAVRTKWIVADVSLAVGVVGAGFFTAFVLAPLFRGADSANAASALSHVGVAPIPRGAAASFRADF